MIEDLIFDRLALEGALHKNMVEKTMSDGEVRLVAETLCEAIQGLVPEEAFNTIYAVRKATDKNASRHARLGK